MSQLADPNPSSPAIPTTKGAPKTRFKNAYQVWQICDELEKQDRKRKKKRERIYKAYNRFPPGDYSTLWKNGQEWQSNCNFGMMAYVVDNTMTSFYDMVTERVLTAQIKTKHGKPADRVKWGEFISMGFDKVIRGWDDYLLNIEQDTLDMLLYGKGIQLKEDEEGIFSEHISADDIIMPDGTKLSLKNFDMVLIKRRYQLHEIWDKIEDESAATQRGWKRPAVLSSMIHQRKAWSDRYKEGDSYVKDINEGNVSLGSHLKEHLDCYMLLVKEFDGKISKYIVLRDYGPIISLTRKQNRNESQDKIRETVINREGFLFSKENWADNIQDNLQVFIDNSGQGMWYATPSLAEKIFVQCRQYDFTMNAIMDAIKMNMSLMLQASTSDASEKIKALVFGPYTIIPADVPFVQQRLQLPTGEATNALQFMMLDMFRGIGEYRVNEGGQQAGQQKTATQTQIDSAEAAKLQGTQLKRFNDQHSKWQRATYKRMVNCKEGELDYEHFKKFKELMKEYCVPEAAWKYDNIESVESNMLAGAGSPSYKLMAAEKTIQITNISPRGEGQANAIEDALAALHGRSNVSRYMPKVQPDLTFDQRLAHMENQMLGNIFCNPADVQVMPNHDDSYHLEVHLEDMQRTVSLVNEMLGAGKVPDSVADTFMFKMMNQGAHCQAHIQKLSTDEGKKDIAALAIDTLGEMTKAAEMIRKKLEEVKANQGEGFDAANDPQVMKEMALSQIKVQQAETMAAISTGAQARKHEQRVKIDQEKAANSIAIERAKAEQQAKTEKKKTKTDQ
jgi:hypothetical protein